MEQVFIILASLTMTAIYVAFVMDKDDKIRIFD